MATITGTNGRNELEGTRFADLIRGRGGNDEFEGNGGNDTIYGDSGNDEIDGGAGKDLLWGGAGNDRLDGGAGNDRLWGGAGRDLFEFERGDGRDVIEDFQDGLDRIDLDDFDFRSAAQALSHAVQVGDDVRFEFGAGGALRLVDVELRALGASDFIL